MFLYHFTDIHSLAPIFEEGLRMGNLNNDQNSGRREGITWLTTNPSPTGHGLTFGEPVTEFERYCYFRRFKQEFPAAVTHWPDKSAVRIKVLISSRDRSLFCWKRWSHKRIDRDPMDLANIADATNRSARTWYFYRGTIDPGRFVEVKIHEKPSDLRDEFNLTNDAYKPALAA